ncbi:MAG: 23S rRNA (adenine(2503)-C2)-methyltransferase [Roseiflexaceae bacterium]
MMSNERPDLYDLTLPELERLLAAWNQPAYRARQLYRQLYVHLTDRPAAMTDLPIALRERLAAETRIGSLELLRLQTADAGLTRKALFRLHGSAASPGDADAVAESVLMVYPDRATVCVSTQAGCAMGCVFCATGRMGLLRNLSPGEIVEQVLWAARELKVLSSELGVLSSAPARDIGSPNSALNTQNSKLTSSELGVLSSAPARDIGSPNSALNTQNSKLTNLVFMGMGEPFANYDRWWQAVERLHDPQGFNMGARSMTVSTVGLAPGIRRLAGEALPINLAISLHSPDDELRSEMMPINRRYPIAALLDATHEYIARTNRRVSFEYVLLQGKNDRPEQAEALAELLLGRGADGGTSAHEGTPLLCHVNLIPWNPVPGAPLGRSERARVLRFQQTLQAHGIPCTVRVERGMAIAAACGQLAGMPAAATMAIEV